ncbi:hypothetical protein K438DRAFT_1750399 [Mycena galopus ATCC 62051]|nr:hypothetical protein K438DRAFT_1750399 [Mycena galopus ATCC 62051]
MSSRASSQAPGTVRAQTPRLRPPRRKMGHHRRRQQQVVARPRGLAQAFDGGEGPQYREAAQASPTPSSEHLALEAGGGEAGGSFRTSGSGKSTTALDGDVGGDSVDAWSAGNVRGSSEFAIALSFSPSQTTSERSTFGAGGSTARRRSHRGR